MTCSFVLSFRANSKYTRGSELEDKVQKEYKSWESSKARDKKQDQEQDMSEQKKQDQKQNQQQGQKQEEAKFQNDPRVRKDETQNQKQRPTEGERKHFERHDKFLD